MSIIERTNAMNRHTRRRLGTLGLSAGFLAVLTGCSTIEGWLKSTTPAQWATDIASIASWGPQIVAELQALKVSAATVAKVQSLFATVAADATAVANATAAVVTGTTLAGYVQEAVQTIAAIANVVMPLFPVTAPLVAVVDAFLALLPMIASALGLTSAPMLAVQPRVALTAPQARAILAVPH
jgi:hypothetical protein